MTTDPLQKLLDYCDDSAASQYGTLSVSLVRELVAEALAGNAEPVAQVVDVDPPGPDGHGVNWLNGHAPRPGTLLYAHPAGKGKPIPTALARRCFVPKLA